MNLNELGKNKIIMDLKGWIKKNSKTPTWYATN